MKKSLICIAVAAGVSTYGLLSHASLSTDTEATISPADVFSFEEAPVPLVIAAGRRGGDADGDGRNGGRGQGGQGDQQQDDQQQGDRNDGGND